MTMSLYRLGIGSSPLSPLRRQFSSSFSNNSASPAVTRDGGADADDELSEPDFRNRESWSGNEDDDDDLTQDSKDVLVDRLNDLLKRLSSGGSLGGADVSTLHAKVDEMEKVLASDRHHKPSRLNRVRQRPSILQLASPLPIARADSSPQTPEEQQHPDYWGFSRTPPQQQLAPPLSELFSPRDNAKDLSTHLQTQPVDEEEEPKISSEVADSLVIEAEKLCLELSAVVKNLQDRREESDARPLAPFCRVPFTQFVQLTLWCSISTRCSLIEQRLQLSESWS